MVAADRISAIQIGLIGWIGPVATDFYYGRLIRMFTHAGIALDLTIVHAHTPIRRANLSYNQPQRQATIFAGLTERLAMAGAGRHSDRGPARDISSRRTKAG